MDVALLAAFESRILPALQVDGYRRFAPQHYGRLRGDVLQFLVASFDAGSAQLQLEYASMLLVEPHGFLNFDLGGRLLGAASPNPASASATREMSHTVDALLVDYLAALRPRLERHAQLPGLMDLALGRLGETGSPHVWFTLAVGHALLAQEEPARRYAQEALGRYRALCEPCPDGSPNVNAPWAKRGEQRSGLLIDALYTGRVAPLLDGWRSGTLAALGLGDFVT